MTPRGRFSRLHLWGLIWGLAYTPVYIAPLSLASHFTHPTLAHFTMPPPPVEVDPQLVEIEEWEEAALAALAATIEAFERQRLEPEPMEKRHRDEEVEAEAMEMHKRRRVEEREQQLRQEAATRKAAANARKD